MRNQKTSPASSLPMFVGAGALIMLSVTLAKMNQGWAFGRKPSKPAPNDYFTATGKHFARVGRITTRTSDGGSQNCAATLINDRHVVTAAHCFKFANGGFLTGATFDLLLSNRSVSVQLANFEVHPMYELPSGPAHISVRGLNDVAVGILSRKIAFPAGFPEYTIAEEQNNIPIMGNYLVSYRGPGLRPEIRDKAYAKIAIQPTNPGKAFAIDMTFPGNPLLCRSDSGSPILVSFEGRLILSGVTSSVSPKQSNAEVDSTCSNAQYAVFSDLRATHAWIREKLNHFDANDLPTKTASEVTPDEVSLTEASL